jgi:hypothetical protein
MPTCLLLSCLVLEWLHFEWGKEGLCQHWRMPPKWTVSLERWMFSADTVQPTIYERYEWVALCFPIKSSSELVTWYDFDFGNWFFGRHVDVSFRPFPSRSSEVLLSFVLSLLSHIEDSKGVFSPCLPQCVPLLSFVAAVAGTVMRHEHVQLHVATHATAKVRFPLLL